MPFVKPAVLQENTSDAVVRHMLKDTFGVKNDVDKNVMTKRETEERNDLCGTSRQVLVTHYFVTNAGKQPELSDSESPVSVGGLDNVDCSSFRDFHYTALGHIHKPQRMDKESDCMGPVVYAGAPLAYSFSECGQEKSVVLVELDHGGVAAMERIPLVPLHKMRKLKGDLTSLISPMIAEMEPNDDYLQITLTNEEELIDPIGTLRRVYPNVMQLLFEKREKEISGDFIADTSLVYKSPEELFADFYTQVRNQEMDEVRRKIMGEVVSALI